MNFTGTIVFAHQIVELIFDGPCREFRPKLAENPEASGLITGIGGLQIFISPRKDMAYAGAAKSSDNPLRALCAIDRYPEDDLCALAKRDGARARREIAR